MKIRTLLPNLQANIAKEAIVYTDEAMRYDNLGKHFVKHDTELLPIDWTVSVVS